MVDASAVWQTPIEQTDGTVIDETEWNEQLAQNLAWLKDPPNDDYTYNLPGDLTTASNSFADCDSTNLRLDITSIGGDIYVGVDVNVSHDTALAYVHFELDIDGSPHYGDDGMGGHRFIATTEWVHLFFMRKIEGLSAAAHIIKLQWKTSAGNVTMSAGAGTASRDVHGQIWGYEK